MFKLAKLSGNFNQKFFEIIKFLVNWWIVIWLIGWYWLLWLFGNSEWQVIILSAGSALCWPIGWLWLRLRLKFNLPEPKTSFDSGWIWRDSSFKPWLIWLGCLILTTYTSQIWPISWLQINWWLATLSWFWWLGSLRPVVMAQKIVLNALIFGVLSAVLGGWWLAWLQPAWISSLSSLTYIFPSFGHHHLAALIVLIWPFIWSKLTTVKINWFWKVAGTIFVLSLITSFSRSALIAVSLQLLIWYWLEAKKLTVFWFRLWQSVLVILLGGFFVLGLFKFVTNWLGNSQFATTTSVVKVCYASWAPAALCSSTAEPRFIYWHQAMIIWQHFPWLGSGPGTYGLVKQRWISQPINQSNFAHQVVLQNLAEMGLVGLACWFLLIGNWLIRFWQQSRLKNDTLAWRLGILGGLIIGLFDFDWQMMGFWLPFISLIVVWLPEINLKQPRIKIGWLNLAAKLFLIASLGFMALASILGGLSLQPSNQPDWLKKWWHIWPMQAEWYQKISLTDSNLEFFSQYLANVVPNHPELVALIGLRQLNLSQKSYWREIQWQLDPWKYWESNPISLAVENNDWVQAEKIASRFEEWLIKNQPGWPTSQNENFITNFIKLANHEFLVGNYSKGVRFIQLAQKLEIWTLHLKKLDFSEINRRLPALADVSLAELAKLNQSKFGESQPDYLYWYQQLTAKAILELKAVKIYQTWLNDHDFIKSSGDPTLLLSWATRADNFAKVYDQIFPQDLSRLDWQKIEVLRLKTSAKIFYLKYDISYRSWLADPDIINSEPSQKKLLVWSELVFQNFGSYQKDAVTDSDLFDWQIQEIATLKNSAQIFQLKLDPIYLNWLNSPQSASLKLGSSNLKVWSENVLILSNQLANFLAQEQLVAAWQIKELSRLELAAEIVSLKNDPVYQNCSTNLQIAILPINCSGMDAWGVKVQALALKFLDFYPNQIYRPPVLAEALADLVVTAGDVSVGKKTFQVARLYLTAQKICPWIMSYRLWWFEVVGANVYPDKQELFYFADAWNDFLGEAGGHKLASWKTFFETMLGFANSSQNQNRQKLYQDKLKLIQANLE